MLKTTKRMGLLMLCIILLASMAAPVSASSKGNGILNVKFAPPKEAGTVEVNGIEYTAYKIAVFDGKTYTLTAAFAECGVDLDQILQGGQLADQDVDVQKSLLTSLGNYINKNRALIEANAAEGDILTAVTETRKIGAQQEETDGVAQFTDLEDGLYLVTTNATIRHGSRRFTPSPFLVNMPFVYNGVTNTYVTATVKFSSKKIGGDDPTTPPTTPPTTDEPVIDIMSEDVPLGDMPDLFEPDFEIPEDEVPLAQLPITGLLWWPVPVLALAGLGFIGVGSGLIRKANHEA